MAGQLDDVLLPQMTTESPEHAIIREVCGQVADIDGDAAELGVYRGASLAVICDALPGVMVYGFDSFCGLPKPGQYDGNREGLFADTSEVVVREAMGHRTNYKLIPGWFHETLPTVSIDRLRFVHLDCDNYDSYHTALDWAWPRLAQGGKIFADDYGHDSCRGATRAIDEFTARQCGCAVVNPWKRRIVLVKIEGGNDGN